MSKARKHPRRHGSGSAGKPKRGRPSRPSAGKAPQPRTPERRRAPVVNVAASPFTHLGLSLPVVQALASSGITTPFPIQKDAIPPALARRDVIGRGPTGSGKTLAFGLPIIERLRQGASLPKKPRALILAPTRELATQIRHNLEGPANNCGQRVLDVVGGVKIARHVTQLARPVDILVATPGRATDLLERGDIDLSAVQMCVLDEADLMSDMGFLPQVTRLLDEVPPTAQHLLFSATLDTDVAALVERYLRDPVTISTAAANETAVGIEHILVPVASGSERAGVIAALARTATTPGTSDRIVMFMKTKYAVDRLVDHLAAAGITAVGLHGHRTQASRARALSDFDSGQVRVLVATDVAARGIDISNVTTVVHVDPPDDPKTYIHRAGRTARAGATGRVVTLCFHDRIDAVRELLASVSVSPTTMTEAQLLGGT